MRLWRDPEFAGPCVLVLGMFDGVHRGHQALLMAGVELAESTGLPLNVCTFEPHPMQVLRPEILVISVGEKSPTKQVFIINSLFNFEYNVCNCRYFFVDSRSVIDTHV